MDLCKKKQKEVNPSSPNKSQEGNAWVYAGIKRQSYFIIALSVGKWTQETCKKMITKICDRIKKPTIQCKLEIFTDGNDDYTYVIPGIFPTDCVNYGQLIKIKENGRLVDKIKTIVFGSPSPEDIETTNIENMNGIFRERNGRVVRKTKCFSKRFLYLESALSIFHFYWNFINNYQRKATPAMLEQLADHSWSWNEFLTFHTVI